MALSGARKILILVSVAELLAKSLMFSGTAVIPQLAIEWHAGVSLTSWLTITVQLGFVAGALLLAMTNLLDLTSAARIFAVSSFLGALFNALFAAVAAQHITAALLLRFLTGMTAAGVYPTGMKILTGWFRQGRGLAMGIVVGAITVGSALPHAVHVGSLPWRDVVYVCSVFSVFAGLAMFGVSEGPYESSAPRLDIHQISEIMRNRRLRLANLGYLGHMWELYAMWGWITLLLAAAAPSASHTLLEAISFISVAVGFLGCTWAGYLSDRNQLSPIRGTPQPQPQPHGSAVRARARVTILAMITSGACCVLASIFFHHFWVLVAIALVWGVSVVADSAQFSTIVTEVSNQRYVGTALTVQTALGFLLTSVSIKVVAAIGSSYGWRWAALSMAAGPIVGIAAMLRLEALPTPLDTEVGTAVPVVEVTSV